MLDLQLFPVCFQTWIVCVKPFPSDQTQSLEPVERPESVR